ncbi:MAG: ABC transporter ATP-binding protein [Opitutales bacterium]|nr:ABC transporter ATP-binding protein [Opitutales bacterium]
MNAPFPLIRMRGVGKVFSTERVDTNALSAIDLDLERGDYLCVSGPSGCGKSTLLSILGLLEQPSVGDYWFKGVPLGQLGDTQLAHIRNREIGFVFQSFNLIGNLTVWENVELPLTYRGMGAKERRQRVKESLERVGMIHRSDHFPKHLSGGQQQSVAIARALGGHPSILLCDEPTGNLDSRNGEMVMDIIDGLHRDGTTLCMVTHDPRFAAHARQHLRLFDGKIENSRYE